MHIPRSYPVVAEGVAQTFAGGLGCVGGLMGFKKSLLLLTETCPMFLISVAWNRRVVCLYVPGAPCLGHLLSPTKKKNLNSSLRIIFKTSAFKIES